MRDIQQTDLFPAEFLDNGLSRFFPITMASYPWDGPAADEVLIKIERRDHRRVKHWIDDIVDRTHDHIWVRCLGDQVLQDHPWLLLRFSSEAHQAKFLNEFKEYLC